MRWNHFCIYHQKAKFRRGYFIYAPFNSFFISLNPFTPLQYIQAFSQMRLSEASAHLGSFSARVKEELFHAPTSNGREGQIGASWISSTAVKAADAMLLKCPSPYEKRCLLKLLASTDFGDGGSTAAYYQRVYWKINFAQPLLCKDDGVQLQNQILDDSSLLTELEKNGHWEQARNWARQLETSGGHWKSAVHHVTETQVIYLSLAPPILLFIYGYTCIGT